MSENQSGPPKILYHYTSIETFKSILGTKKIRATRYDQMNDGGELQFGVSQLLQSLRLRNVEKADEQYMQFLIREVEGFVDAALRVYILSLSGAADALEQWRAYAPNGGVAIGFNSEEVVKGFLIDITHNVDGFPAENPVRPNPGNQLMRCQYSDASGAFEQPDSLVEKFFTPNGYRAMFGREDRIGVDIFRASLSAAVYRFVSTVKHGAYRHEQEWRCVNVNLDSVAYPVQLSDKNRHFIELPFDACDYVKEVWLSPHGDTIGIRNAVEHLKQSLDLKYEIKSSTIPYRI